MKAMGNISAERRALGVMGRWGVWWWCERNQQVEESVETTPTEMTEGLLRGCGHVGIETTKQCPRRRSDPIDAATAIAGIGTPHDVSVTCQTRDQASEIGIARDHALADLGAGESAPSRRTEN